MNNDPYQTDMDEAWEQAKREQADDDAISRQDAIKAIDEKAKRIKNEDTLNGLAGAVGILFDLPTVNPQPKIVRCSQCKYAEVADSEDSQDGYTCQFHRGSIWFSGSYCSWAERRQNE